MSMLPFGLLLPDLANDETRSLTVRKDLFREGKVVLPAGDYGFPEYFCVDPDCDCRNVVIQVITRGSLNVLATINHFFDAPGPNDNKPAQTFLDPINQQSKWSAALLEIFCDLVLADKNYCRRLERHYKIVKNAAADPAHPCQRFIRDPKFAEQHVMIPRESTVSSSRRSPIPPPPPRRGKRKWR